MAPYFPAAFRCFCRRLPIAACYASIYDINAVIALLLPPDAFAAATPRLRAAYAIIYALDAAEILPHCLIRYAFADYADIIMPYFAVTLSMPLMIA